MAFIMQIISGEWVEIPQIMSSGESSKSDLTMYILTTTSTTTEIPIFPKPSQKRNFYNNSRKSVVLNTEKTSIKSTNTPRRTITESMDKKFNATPNRNKIAKLPNKKATKPTTNFRNITQICGPMDNFEDEQCIKQDTSNNFGDFIPYLSTVQSTLMKNAHKNKKSKIGVLTSLRDHLLFDIKNRISNLWSNKNEGRSAREHSDDSQIDFPSNEGALMTIGFLTFAVFLIKLVLQLIQKISNNTNTETVTATFVGRKRREAILDEETIRIMNIIEQLKFK